MSIRVEEFGTTKDGQKVKKYILENGKGMKAAVLNLGAVLAELHVPDKDGTLRDVVWGYEDVAGYEVNGPECQPYRRGRYHHCGQGLHTCEK